ncbi:MAG: hypothetical protein COA78_19810 [Blastopirellula sp.]|nr:MAG: hypothetical protein COA78_19810 [Blastopirellula sp.]
MFNSRNLRSLFVFAWLVVAIVVFIAGCDATDPSINPTVELPSDTTSLHSTAKIPDDLTYTIVDHGTLHRIKRSIQVRLSRKVSEEVLTALALKLKNADPVTYERTFIGYHLPGMPTDDVYWATTHFNPILKVRILGLTVEQEEALRKLPVDSTRKIIGSWINERLGSGSKVTIFQKGPRIFIEHIYGDGSSGIKEVVETRSQNGRRFDFTKKNDFGDYYLINSRGELQQGDQDGLFWTMTTIVEYNPPRIEIIKSPIPANVDFDPQPRRTFTDVSGEFKIEATLVRFVDKTVTLQTDDGNEVNLAIDQLSMDDRNYIRGEAKKIRETNP